MANPVSRILYVAASSPVPSKIGAARRNFHVIEQLSRAYNVSVICLVREPVGEILQEEFSRIVKPHFVLRRRGSKSRFLLKVWRTATGRCDFLPVAERDFRVACRNFFESGCFDAIFLSTLLLGGLPLPDRIPLICDSHNVEFDVHRRTAQFGDTWLNRIYARAQTASTRRAESRNGMKADLLLATSSRDASVFQKELKIKEPVVVPNGIDLSEFAPSDESGEPFTILFTGLMAYYPNEQGIRWFLNSVFPVIRQELPRVRLVVAGAGPRPWLRTYASHQIEITGAVADMRPYLRRARVVIAPLHIGGGTRVKILEAQAMAKPVVSTTLGAEGLLQVNGTSILLADGPEEFAASVVRLLRDEKLAKTIGENGLLHVRKSFDWNRIGEALNRTLETRIGLTPRREEKEMGAVQS